MIYNETASSSKTCAGGDDQWAGYSNHDRGHPEMGRAVLTTSVPASRGREIVGGNIGSAVSLILLREIRP